MKHKDISNSSQIKRIGYDGDNKIFEIAFKTGATYHYFGVPQSKWDEALAVIEGEGSIGKYCAAEIKSIYKYKLIEK